MTVSAATDTRLRSAAALALGLALPAMVSGRAVLQGLAALALVLVLVIAARDQSVFARAGGAIRTRFGVMIMIAFAGMAVCIPGSLDPMRSLEGWARTLAYVGACVLFWAMLVNDERRRRLTLRAFLVAWLIGLIAVGIAQITGWEFLYRVLRNDFVPWNSNWPFHTAKAYAALGACCIPVTIWIARREASAWRVVGMAVALGQTAIVVSTVNKSGLAGVLAMILAVSFAMALRGGRKWLATWVLWAATATAAVLFLVYELPDEPANRPVWDWVPPQIVDTHRQQIWHFTVGKIVEKPWTGYGINVINKVPGADKVLDGYHAEAIPSHPHNWMLEILGETGVFGFLPVLLAVAWAAGRNLLRYMRAGEGRAMTLLGLSAVFWGSSLFNFSIWSSWWLIGYFLLWALVAAGTPGAQSAPPSRLTRGG
tara:strand:- start:741 stop:2018 length:1278 start_codon:yes stop_codon:yes gene_type:complete